MANHFNNTSDEIWWLRQEFNFLSLPWGGYQPQHGPFAPYKTLEHFLLAERTIPEQQQRAANMTSHRDIRRHYHKGIYKERPDWQYIRDMILWNALLYKYTKEDSPADLKVAFINTYPKYKRIIDCNTSCINTHWGYCVCNRCKGKGENIHGIFLIYLRNQIITGGSLAYPGHLVPAIDTKAASK